MLLHFFVGKLVQDLVDDDRGQFVADESAPGLEHPLGFVVLDSKHQMPSADRPQDAPVPVAQGHPQRALPSRLEPELDDGRPSSSRIDAPHMFLYYRRSAVAS